MTTDTWIEDKAAYISELYGEIGSFSGHKAAIAAALRAAEKRGMERALLVAAKQRCERGTDWDAACQAILKALRAAIKEGD